MTESDRRRLEALAYGRSTDEAVRAEAMRGLRELDARPLVAPEAPTAPASRPSTRRFRWWIPLGAVAGAATLLAVVWFALPPVVPSVPVTQRDTPDGIITPVTPSEFRGPAEGIRYDSLLRGDYGDATPLGENARVTAYGIHTDDNGACIAMLFTPDSAGGKCVGAEEFERDGLTMDRGSWSVSWFADGSISWKGI